MAAEEGPVEDSFELPALLALVRRAPGPEVRPPGEAGSSKSSHLQDLGRLSSVVEKKGIGIWLLRRSVSRNTEAFFLPFYTKNGGPCFCPISELLPAGSTMAEVGGPSGG